MIELKTCPFCGSKAVMQNGICTEAEDKESKIEYFVNCSNESCIAHEGRDENFKWFLSKQEAAEAWNKRSNGWVSVDDRLPEESGDYLVFVEGLIENMMYSKRQSAWNATDLNCHKNYEITTVTHWMKLPEPPTLEGDE